MASSWLLDSGSWLLGFGFRPRIDVLGPSLYKILATKSVMSPRPVIFISAVSSELRSARQLVANPLTFLGYEPEWQEIFGTEQGDLRGMLRRRVEASEGVVQLVGDCYGAEPPTP